MKPQRSLMLPMLVCGLVAAAPAGALGRWEWLAPALRAHTMVSLAASATLILAGMRLLKSGQSRASVGAGAAAAMVAGLNIVTGISLGTIPCSGPG